MRRSARVLCGVGALGVLGWISGCQGDAAGPNTLVDPDTTEATDTVTVNISNAVSGASIASFSRSRTGRGLGLAQVGEGEVAYISLRPGSVLDGVRVVITNPLTGALLTTAVTDGGFDPVPVRAAAGDVVDLTVTTASGDERRFSVRVPGRKSPKVVRTVPPRGKTGVPLNSNIVIVFSEPVVGGTLTPTSVKVLRDGTAIAGSVRLLEGAATSAVFEPAAPLDPNTVYKLVVTNSVTDLAGDSLSGRVAREFTTGSSVEGSVNYVRVRPDSLEIAIGAQVQFTATAFDVQGNALAGLPVTWRSQDPSVAAVSATGLVTGLARGYATIFADIGGSTGNVILGVAVSPSLASVELSTDSAAIRVGGSQWLYVILKDSAGNTLYLPRLTQWTSSNTAVATVADSGSRTAYVTGVAEGLAKIAVWVEGKSDTVTILVSNTATLGPSIVATTPVNGATGVSRRTTVAVTFRDFINQSSMYGTTPAFTVTGESGAVRGEISSDQSYKTYTFTPTVALESGKTYTARVSTAVQDINGNALAADYVWTFTTEAEAPLSAAAVISANGVSACALTTSGAAYCWGSNSSGQVGDGTVGSDVWYAAPSASGLAFTDVSVGGAHTCGISTSGAAHCWGFNSDGALGDGTTIWRLTPVPVAGALRFATMSADSHTCGVTPEGAAYCWGRNSAGKLGDGTTTTRLTPTLVAGGLSFSTVSTGYYHTCGLTTAGSAFCWGDNYGGQLGDGTQNLRNTPGPVSGGLTFQALTAGSASTCGIATGGAAYCWGINLSGELGDGTTTSRLTPVAVTGGLTLISLTGGSSHTCGITVAGSAYCWGANYVGQLGDGTTTNRSSPVLVTGGLSFTAIAAGADFTCGVTNAGAVYCWGWNRNGQLGNGSTANSSVPVRVIR